MELGRTVACPLFVFDKEKVDYLDDGSKLQLFL